MSPTLYHCSGARSVRALWALEELGIDFELVTMAFPPRYLHEGYRDLNPIGTVPYFTDGNVEMTESSGIAHYVCQKYGPTDLLVSPDEADYGAFLNWMYRSDATFTFPQTIFLRYTQLEPEETRNPKIADDYRKWFLARMRSVEAGLEGKEYLCSGRFTIADICVGYAVMLALSLKIDEVLTPNIKAWWERISARPAFERASK
jgi:glutathione S-transferase